MKLILLHIFSLVGFFSTSIYSLQVTSIDNVNLINLSSYQGKKILFVNIATGSDNVEQLSQLEQLYQQYSDSLVVIAFPSNSFNNEPLSNSGIRQFLTVNYGVSFPIASTASVKGSDMQAVYQWLTKQSENGVMDAEVKDDFQKYLVNSQGELVAIFSGSMPANHIAITDAITQN